MFLLNLIRYLRGYVTFQAEGDFVERFLNLCARDHIPVWDSHRRGSCYTACTNASNYRRLRQHAKKTNVHICLKQKEGAPFTRHRYRKRKGLVLGVVIFLAFLYGMSSFIWRIEIDGQRSIPDSRIIDVMEKVGVSPGSLRRGIDVRDSERRALIMLPELSWLAINIEGSTARIKVDERVMPLPVVDPHDPCNVVATKTGQIVSMNVYSGQALVKQGDTVMAGDVIISGITQDRLGQNLFRHARAKVIARIEHDITVEVPLSQIKYEPTGEINRRRYLNVFGLDLPLQIPFRIAPPYHVERQSEGVSAFSAALPVSILTEDYVMMEEVPVIYTEDEAREMAKVEIAAIEKVELGEAKILERTAKASLSEDVLTATAHYIAETEIGMEKEILLEEQSDR